MPRGNPFYYNLPTRPEDFIGRWPLVEEIVADLCRPRPDSWAVIGGRRFGKSSVLKAVESRLAARLSGCKKGDRHIIPLVVDLKRCGTESEHSVYACIARALHRTLRRSHEWSLNLSETLLHTIAVSHEEALSFYRFEDALDDLATNVEEQLGPLRLILLLDEVEATTRFPWSETLFNQMRALIYDGPPANVVRLVLTGSAQVIRVRHAGSPLLNAVKIVHLKPFSEADMQDLIARGGKVADEVCSAVWVQSGGHPFIAQYLLHHLWDDGLMQATLAQVELIARQMRRRRAADLQGWWEAIGDSGRKAYEVLAAAGDWLYERMLLAEVQGTEQPPDHGLAALCYHGLSVRDASERRYRAVGSLFRGWYAVNIAGSELLTTPVPSAPAIEGTFATSMLEQRPPRIYRPPWKEEVRHICLDDLVKNVDFWNDERGLGLTFCGQRSGGAAWAVGNVLIEARAVTMATTEIRVDDYTWRDPDDTACRAWRELQTLFEEKGVEEVGGPVNSRRIAQRTLSRLQVVETVAAGWPISAESRSEWEAKVRATEPEISEAELVRMWNDLCQWVQTSRATRREYEMRADKTADEAAAEFFANLEALESQDSETVGSRETADLRGTQGAVYKPSGPAEQQFGDRTVVHTTGDVIFGSQPDGALDLAPSPEATRLHRILSDRMDLEEFRTLCFDLGVSYDSLRGEGLAGKARQLVLFLQKRKALPRLVEWLRRERPDIRNV